MNRVRAAFRALESYLGGWPDGMLTLALLVAAGILILIAVGGRPLEKATALAYVVFP